MMTENDGKPTTRKKKYEERRGGSREWQRFKISLAFEHRFVIKRENIMCQ
jgi:hypothetical protein